MGPLKPDLTELAIGLVLFFVVFGSLAGVLLPRITKALAAREEAIDGRLERAEATKAEAERIAAEYRALMAQARHEAAMERQRGTEEGVALLAGIRAEGQRQREEIVATGQARIAADRALAEAQLRHDVGTLAVELAGRIIGEPLDESVRDSEVLDRFFAELESD